LGVSCPSATSCTAVGYSYDSAGTRITLAEARNGTTWAIEKTPYRAGSELLGVSCSSSSSCIAVGADGNATLAEAWNGTTWGIEKTPYRKYIELSGVSCLSAAACTAVGTNVDYFANEDVAIAETWNGSTWTFERTAYQSGIGYVLSGVSCTWTAIRAAVGSNYVPASGGDGLDGRGGV
jgi:hypothetical protein